MCWLSGYDAELVDRIFPITKQKSIFPITKLKTGLDKAVESFATVDRQNIIISFTSPNKCIWYAKFNLLLLDLI